MRLFLISFCTVFLFVLQVFAGVNDSEAQKLVNYFAQKGDTLSLEDANKMVEAGLTLDSLSLMMGFTGMEQEYEDIKAVQSGGTIAPKDNFLSDKWWHTATIEDVQKELQKGADVNAKDKNGMTPLIYAVMLNKNVEIFDLLIKKGADVNAESSLRTIFSEIKISPLMMAVSSNASADIIEVLLKNGADIKPFNNELLKLASKHSNWRVFDLLLDYGADMFQEDENGYSVMQELVSDEDTAKPEIIQQWYDRGAIIDKDILFKLNKNASSETIEFLIKNGADVNAVNDGGSFLISAAYSINHDVAETLIRLGADVKFVSAVGWTALFSALENKDIEVFKLLLENGGESIINQVCRDETVLEKAIRLNKTEYVKLLEEHGADNTKRVPAPMSKEKRPIPVMKIKVQEVFENKEETEQSINKEQLNADCITYCGYGYFYDRLGSKNNGRERVCTKYPLDCGYSCTKDWKIDYLVKNTNYTCQEAVQDLKFRR